MVNNLYTLTLLKAFDILDCFQTDRQEIGIKEIASMIDMPQSSVYRIIQSLEFEGFIFQNKKTKKYRIGTKLLALSGKCSCLNDYLQVAVRHMESLSRETGETVNLATPSCDKITNIYKIESQHVLRPNFTLNTPYPAYCTGLGKVLLSEMSNASLHWVYDNNRETIKMELDDFLEDIHEVRKNGYAYDDQIFSQGLRCVAAPVRGPGGKVIFAISVSAPVTRMGDDTYQKTRDLVIHYTTLASQEIQEMT
ncbi:MAG: IclR family transcriptional regulator [Oscillospiraceae bacterium]